MNRYAHVIAAVYERPWAILPTTLAVMVELLRGAAAGVPLGDDEIQERLAFAAATNGRRGPGGRQGVVGVVPVHGTIAPRVQGLRASGGTTVDAIAADFRAMLDAPDVDAIVFDIDSPGGVVDGVDELAAEIREARGRKPIAAVANTMAASAAYWIGSAADELVVTPSGVVGSIGVFTAHQDLTKAAEVAGVKTTLISAGKYKTEGNPYEPLSDEAREATQKLVDGFYGMMVGSIARSRGVGVDTVRKGYGEGRVVMAKAALEAGMVDRVDTLTNTLRRASRGALGSRDAATAAYVPSVITVRGALGAGTPLGERLELASLEAAEIAELVRARKALRMLEGRDLSSDTVADARAFAAQLREAADALEADDDAGTSSASSTPPVSPAPDGSRWLLSARAQLAATLAEAGLVLND